MLWGARSIATEREMTFSVCARAAKVVVSGGASGFAAPYFIFFTMMPILVTRKGALWARYQG